MQISGLNRDNRDNKNRGVNALWYLSRRIWLHSVRIPGMAGPTWAADLSGLAAPG